eukprot:2034406-Prymnesium_polylepis.2
MKAPRTCTQSLVRKACNSSNNLNIPDRRNSSFALRGRRAHNPPFTTPFPPALERLHSTPT